MGEKNSNQKHPGYSGKINLLRFLCYIVSTGFISGLLAIDDPPDFYKTLLTEAEYYYFQKRPEISREKLSKLQTEYPQFLEFGYFRLSARLYEDSGHVIESLEEYERALNLKKDDPELALKLFKGYDAERKLRKSFNYLRIYLSLVPGDLSYRLKSLVYASRLGERKYFEFAQKKINSLVEADKESDYLKNIEKVYRDKKYSECRQLSLSLREKYPFNKKYHHFARICQSYISTISDDMEDILLTSAAIFYKEKKYSLELAQYYLKNKRNFSALNLFRRTFSQALQNDGLGVEEEILFLIRDIYFKMGWMEDARDVSSLIDIIRRKEHVPAEDFEALYLLNKNREVIVYAIYYFSSQKSNKVPLYLERLKERDSKRSDKEFMNVFPVFDYEVNTDN